jgi:hypothetical protein
MCPPTEAGRIDSSDTIDQISNFRIQESELHRTRSVSCRGSCQTAAMDMLLRRVRDVPGSLDYLHNRAA